MSFKLIPPGKAGRHGKRGNPYYYVRGTTLSGERHEVSTKTTDPIAAEKFKAEFELALLRGNVPGAGEAVSYRQASELYRAFRNPSPADVKRHEALEAYFDAKPVKSFIQADLVKAAEDLKPARPVSPNNPRMRLPGPGTRNREVMRPAAAVLHYAAENQWCGWLRIKLFKEPRAKTRAVTEAVAARLIAEAPDGAKRLFLLWAFKQGDRLGDILRVTWADIDLPAREIRQRIGKADDWVVSSLDDEVWEELANTPEASRTGYLFPWRTKSGVYAWLRKLTLKHGVRFTPHMARHSVGKWLNDAGAGLRTIMGKLHHKDAKSSIRYQAEDIDVIRAISRKTPRLGGKQRGKIAKKARKA